MSKNIIFLIMFFILLLIPFITKGAVVINEIMYDLEEGSDSGREWVEIFNSGDAAIDLTGWKFFENETNHNLTLIQDDINIPQNGYAVITDKPDKFLIDNPGYSGILFDSAFSLSNSGENLAIKDSELTIVDQVTYDSSWGAAGDGNSLQKKDSSDWGVGNPTPGTTNNFSTGEEPDEPEEPEEEPETPSTPTSGGSSNQPPIADAGNDIIAFIDQEITFDGSGSRDPDGSELAYEWNLGEGNLKNDIIITHKYSYSGTYLVTLMVYDGRHYSKNTITVKIYPQKITINEFLPSPIGKDAEEEWIELYNDSDSVVDISGWQLDDEDGGSKPFVFPENTLIAPKSYSVFSRQITKIALNNDDDKVRLLLSTKIVFQEVSYEKAPKGKSSAKTPAGFVWSTPTPGFPNIIGTEKQEFVYKGSLQSENTD